MFDRGVPHPQSTPDLERALGFYRDLLDGTVTYRFPPTGEPVFVSLDIGSSPPRARRTTRTPRPGGDGQRFALWVYADELRRGGASGCGRAA